jgi:hypothetical protein
MLDVEIARLRDLDIGGLQVRWQTCFGGDRPLTCLVIFCFAFWPIDCRPIGSDAESQRLLDATGSPEDVGKRAVEIKRVERPYAEGRRRRWLCLERQDLSEPVDGRQAKPSEDPKS